MARPTASQIQGLRHKLITQRESLFESAQAERARWTEHPMGELSGEVADEGDASVASLVTDLDHSALQRHVGTIREIDAALARIHDGDYATCFDCGDDIDVERLRAFPTAKRCVACQTRRERTFAEALTPTL